MLLIDIKDFKIINKLKGSKFGDYILQTVARILKERFEDYTIARIGNDEFAIFLPFNSENEVIAIAQQIIENIKTLKFKDVSISANIGISYYDQHASTPKKLIESASAALHMAKKTENSIEIYDLSLYQNFSKYLKTKNVIENSLKNNNFEFFFQPYFSYHEKKFVGAEALLRIKGNTEIKTEEFIKYAEKSRIIKQIELQSFKDLAQIIKKIKFPISFNISPVSLSDEEHMKKIMEIFKGIEKFVTVEITERLLLKDSLDVFRKLKEKGFKIAIDDFGSGYASFKYLKNLLADILKIDKEFVENIANSTNDRKIVEIIIDFANKFEMNLIAEGVENKDQENILSKLGCNLFQGYYYSKPLPLQDFEKLLKNS
jgi:diguanylate cyclase (GGDEF)-like protein